MAALVAGVCGLAVAVIGLGSHGLTFGTGYTQARGAIEGVPLPTFFFLEKFAAGVLSMVSGIPGGIFTPSLAIGAGIGANVAHFMTGMAEPRVLALVSMAAFLAAATQAPITASVMKIQAYSREASGKSAKLKRINP